MKARIYTKEIMDQVYEKDGWLYWKENSKNHLNKDSLAGHLDKATGYYRIRINRKNYMLHRILYQLYHNIILEPEQQIDHINLDKTDNRKENLRLSTSSQNMMNRKTYNNSTMVKNITISKSKNYEYYHLQIKKDKKTVYSKYFRIDKYTIEEVVKIRDKMLLEIHKEFANKN